MRKAIHNIAYTVVNSNAMQGVAPGSYVERKISPWKLLRLVISIVLVALIILMIVSIKRRKKNQLLYPEKYKPVRIKAKKKSKS